MKIEIIDWQGMEAGKVLDLDADTCRILTDQKKAKAIDGAKQNKGTGKSDTTDNIGGGEAVAEGSKE